MTNRFTQAVKAAIDQAIDAFWRLARMSTMNPWISQYRLHDDEMKSLLRMAKAEGMAEASAKAYIEKALENANKKKFAHKHQRDAAELMDLVLTPLKYIWRKLW
jgi:hypothetical protein